jgi:hypothetical protein
LRYRQALGSDGVKAKLGIGAKRPSPKPPGTSPRRPPPDPAPPPEDPKPSPPRPRVDFVARNIAQASEPKGRAKPDPKPAEKAPAHAPGEVPRYLEARKASLEAQGSPPPRGPCPPGTRLLDEDEKEEALQALRDEKEELVARLGRLPLSIESPSAIREKRMLEMELDTIENSIAQLSKKFVFVPID